MVGHILFEKKEKQKKEELILERDNKKRKKKKLTSTSRGWTRESLSPYHKPIGSVDGTIAVKL